MKNKVFLLLFCTTVFLISGCRKDADSIINPNGSEGCRYETYADQFDVIWNGINNSYVFWRVDTVDWDARYDRLRPKFEALDRQNIVTNDELSALYKELVNGLIDHHMLVRVWNLKRDPYDPMPYIEARPSHMEVETRSYYHERVNFDKYYQALQNLKEAGRVTELERVNYNDFDVIGCIIDGKYAYLHLNNYKITSIDGSNSNSVEQYQQIRIINDWMARCQQPTTKGVILDNRSNTGGYVHDLRYVITPFYKDDDIMGYTYTKDGLGRLDYSPAVPFTLHGTGASRNDIPKVVLTDLWSVSMGEMSTFCLKMLPNAKQIGERTFGGHGPLNGDYPNHYDGTFGSTSGPHYVYTSSHMMEFKNIGVMEGKGITPDIEVLYDASQMDAGNDVQLNRALEYLNTGN